MTPTTDMDGLDNPTRVTLELDHWVVRRLEKMAASSVEEAALLMLKCGLQDDIDGERYVAEVARIRTRIVVLREMRKIAESGDLYCSRAQMLCSLLDSTRQREDENYYGDD